ncbi:MAG: hypothetical protein Q8M03_01105, partial [Legionella sp.]|nr:hypothetical protein [Legionella sp.]
SLHSDTLKHQVETLLLPFKSVIIVLDKFESLLNNQSAVQARMLLSDIASLRLNSLVLTASQEIFPGADQLLRLSGLTQCEATQLYHMRRLQQSILHPPSFSSCETEDLPIFDQDNPPMRILIGSRGLTVEEALYHAARNLNVIERFALSFIAVARSPICQRLIPSELIVVLPKLESRALIEWLPLNHGSWTMQPTIRNHFKHTVDFSSKVHRHWSLVLRSFLQCSSLELDERDRLAFELIYHLCRQSRCSKPELVNKNFEEIFDIFRTSIDIWACHGQWSQALRALNTVHKALIRQLNNSNADFARYISDCLYHKMTFARRMGQATQAIEYSRDAIESLYRSVPLSDDVLIRHASINFESGNIYLHAFNHLKACRYWVSAIQAIEKTSTPLEHWIYAASFQQIGRVFDQLRLSRSDMAQFCVERAGTLWAHATVLKFSNPINSCDYRSVATSLHVLGTYWLRRACFHPACRYYLRSIRLKHTILDQRGLAMSFLKLSALGVEMLKTAPNNVQLIRSIEALLIETIRISMLLNDHYKHAQALSLRAELRLLEDNSHTQQLAMQDLLESQRLFMLTDSWYREYQVKCRQQNLFLSSSNADASSLKPRVRKKRMSNFQRGKCLASVERLLNQIGIFHRLISREFKTQTQLDIETICQHQIDSLALPLPLELQECLLSIETSTRIDE